MSAIAALKNIAPDAQHDEIINLSKLPEVKARKQRRLLNRSSIVLGMFLGVMSAIICGYAISAKKIQAESRLTADDQAVAAEIVWQQSLSDKNLSNRKLQAIASKLDMVNPPPSEVKPALLVLAPSMLDPGYQSPRQKPDSTLGAIKRHIVGAINSFNHRFAQSGTASAYGAQ
jgi:hypothetical protein